MRKPSSGNDSESTALGWKFVIIVGIITTIFFTFLYLAMSSEPDYMPNQENQRSSAKHNVEASVSSQDATLSASQPQHQ